MSELDPHIKTLLQAIRAQEATYRPAPNVADSLRQKTLVMLVGPVAIGKSFVIDQLTKRDPEFKQVSVFTTREARNDDDPELFRIRPHTASSLMEIYEEIKKGSLVQYTVHPTTDRIYGTVPSDFEAAYNLLPTMSGAVDARAQLPFAASFTICLVARPDVWAAWLHARYPAKGSERGKRLKEAVISLEWALGNKHHAPISWVENSIESPLSTIENIRNIVKYNHPGDPKAKEYAKQMLELAKTELQETI